MRRLVITGMDSEDNQRTLFGPDWKESTGSMWEETRMAILLQPPPGSPSYCYHADLDDESLARSPRPANNAESDKVQKVRDIQAAIVRRVGRGNEPSMHDMKAILSSFGPDIFTMLPLYQVATSTIDQGVPLR